MTVMAAVMQDAIDDGTKRSPDEVPLVNNTA
jgi:hypothetical protein